jgi:hypothetical protein
MSRETSNLSQMEATSQSPQVTSQSPQVTSQSPQVTSQSPQVTSQSQHSSVIHMVPQLLPRVSPPCGQPVDEYTFGSDQVKLLLHILQIVHFSLHFLVKLYLATHKFILPGWGFNLQSQIHNRKNIFFMYRFPSIY